MIEQDQRSVKSRIGTMLGFKVFANAAMMVAGVEPLLRIHKGQFALGCLRVEGKAARAIWDAVLPT